MARNLMSLRRAQRRGNLLTIGDCFVVRVTARRTWRLLAMTVLFCIAAHTPFASADDLQRDRTFDKLWTAYVPQLHEQFVHAIDPFLTTDLRQSLQSGPPQIVRLRLWLDHTAHIQKIDIEKSAQDDAFTHACVRAAHALSRLNNLAPLIRTTGEERGLEFTFGTAAPDAHTDDDNDTDAHISLGKWHLR